VQCREFVLIFKLRRHEVYLSDVIQFRQDMSLATRSEFYRSPLWAGFSRIHYTKQYETLLKGVVEDGFTDLEKLKALVEPSKGQ